MFNSPEHSPSKSLKRVYSRNAFNDKLRANKTSFLTQTCKRVERLKDCERLKLEESPNKAETMAETLNLLRQAKKRALLLGVEHAVFRPKTSNKGIQRRFQVM